MDQELEVKFHLHDLTALESRLKDLGAQQVQVRLHEVNLRLDTAELALTSSRQVLRLRQDDQVRVTYKGPGTTQGGVQVRQEFEFTASDYTAARSLFKALGYDVAMMYEKYRTVYDLDDVHVTLDEMPYGGFCEIEGPRAESIRSAADRLEIAWDKRVLDSYTAIFDQLRAALGFTFRDLSFDNFAALPVSLQVIGIQAADPPGSPGETG